MNVDPSIFKAYDIRGIYPTTINEDIAYKIGQAYVAIVKPRKEVLVGHDVRLHSEALKKKVIEGITDAGIDVLDAGLMSTDMLYFAVGNYKTDGGIQVTASHNPPEWHGAKMVRPDVIPINLESGIGEIRDYIQSGQVVTANKKGMIRTLSPIDDYCRYILSWVNPQQIKPIKVVINPNFGFAGKIFQRIVELGKLPINLISLNNEPDGNFPKGRPDPFVPENRVEFLETIRNTQAQLGITWDADADRVFFSARGGDFIDPYYLNTILIEHMLKEYPGSNIIYDPRYTWATLEVIEKNGGHAIASRVGHSYIKEAMRKNNAVFAGECSGHTYYRDYWFSDCGMIPPMQILEFLSLSGVDLAKAVEGYRLKYIISGEINSDVQDKEGKMTEIAVKYQDGKQSKLDGIAIEYSDWRFCVRPSNTEPLLRLTLEAKTKELMEQKRDEVLSLIRS
ncbi:MAG: phosphomannomutase/phosphoglucomutase [Veillonellaceae bacterium]|nr:phosphomannomutase/phosphoglucomutase [Veillonellaceae bacterium]